MNPIFTIVLSTFAPIDVPVPQSSHFMTDWGHKFFVHALWDKALQKNVDSNGLIDYAGIKRDECFREYLYRLAHTDAADLDTPDDRKAFWINAYNALAIYGVLSVMPEEKPDRAQFSVNNFNLPGFGKGEAFSRGLRFKVGHRRWTLDEIENRVLFRRWEGVSLADREYYHARAPAAADSRAHLALICCARGFPALLPQAFEAERIDIQLEQVTHRFLNDERRNRFDRSGRTWRASMLFEWHGDDFTRRDFEPRASSPFEFAAGYVDDESLSDSLRNQDWRILFIDFDWSLNAR